MSTSAAAHDTLFLGHDGETSRRIMAYDWSGHALGTPETWPSRLKSAISTLLDAADPMFLAWGPDLIYFFNDPCAPLLGPRIEQGIGRSFPDLWSDIWPQISSIVEKALRGESSRYENLPITLARYGEPEEVWFSFSYAPLRDEDGAVCGIYCITQETTQSVREAAAKIELEGRNRQILDSAIDYGIIATDLSGCITRWNEGAKRVLGWTEAEMLGQPADRVFTDGDVQAGVVDAEMHNALHQGRGIDERWHVRKDGTRFWGSGEMTALRDDENVVVGFVKVLRDRTSEREASVALRASRADLARALEEVKRLNTELERRVADRAAEVDRLWTSSPDLLLVLDADGRLIRVNPSWTTILGYQPEDILGRLVTSLIAPDDLETARKALETATYSTVQSLENRYLHKDGSVRWFSWVAAPAGDLIYATGRHITAQREAEAALRDTEDFARLALSAVGGVGVWTFDIPENLFFFDASIAALYGLDLEQGIAGLPSEDFLANVHPGDRGDLQMVMAGGLKIAGDLEYEYRLLHPDGTTRWVLSRGHTYFDSQGVPVRRTGVGVDMTSQRQLEEQLRQSQKMEALGQLTGGIAHDFNNLLTVIRGSAELLLRPALADEKRRRYTNAIADTADRASKLTSQLLSFARRQALTPETFDVGSSISGLRDMIGTLTGSRITLELDVASGPCHVNVDRTQFDTAIVNIAVNARDAMESEGVLRISTARVTAIPAVRSHPFKLGDFVAVTITDTGPGIPAERAEQIFEPFFTTKGVGQGTGLGLSQVFGFAKQSGGDVIAGNADSGGARFTLYLPSAPEPEPSDTPQAEAQVSALGEGAWVLVVEDNAEVGDFATLALAELGYRTVLAADAQLALEALSETDRFQVVFSDIVMPGMSGIELGGEIRRLFPHLPVVLTSGFSDALVQSGASGFPVLQKPYSVEALSHMLSRVFIRH